MFVRSKKINGRQYYYLVRSVRRNGAVRQQCLEYLGPQMPSKRRLQQLIKEYGK
jgi:hypothetical protein